jgi:hypothetical protein
MILEFSVRLKKLIIRLHEHKTNTQKKAFTAVNKHNRQRTDSMQSIPFSVSSNEGSWHSRKNYFGRIRAKLAAERASEAGRSAHEPEIEAWTTLFKRWFQTNRRKFSQEVQKA